jgi:hypothetical protein
MISQSIIRQLHRISPALALATALGLLPAALSHAIGSDSQRPFAIVIVGGLIANLVIGIFLLPTLYFWMARENDVLPAVEVESAVLTMPECARARIGKRTAPARHLNQLVNLLERRNSEHLLQKVKRQ